MEARKELLPTDPPLGSSHRWTPPGAIPPSFRKFGKFFDTRSWRPGDLLLFRDITPDCVGRAIASAQLAGGYAKDDAMWTHVALYIGDGLTVCEATFSATPWGRRGVLLTPLWEYCGASAVRLRRPTAVSTDTDAWLLAIKGLSQLRKAYHFQYLIRLAFKAYRGTGFWRENTPCRIKASALICSTLYADAYARQTGRVLGEQSDGYCTPAYLSQSHDFSEVPLAWLSF